MTIFSKDFVKDPSAKKDYTVEGADYLGDDTFATATWDIPTGMTKVSDSIANGNKDLIVWLSGGTQGIDYDCYVDFTTVGGREDRALLRIRVR